MSHTSEEETQKLFDEAEKKVAIGGIYSHYKNPQNTYKVLNLAIEEATEKVCVVYQAQYGRKLIWVRDLDNWLESVELDNKIVPRFTQIS